MQGRVRWFNNHFGYGFITHKTGEDVFVHYSVINSEDENKKTLLANELVTYSCRYDNMRLKAVRVTRQTKK